MSGSTIWYFWRACELHNAMLNYSWLSLHTKLPNHSSFFCFWGRKDWTKSNPNSLWVVLQMPALQSGKHIRCWLLQMSLISCLKILDFSGLRKWNFRGNTPLLHYIENVHSGTNPGHRILCTKRWKNKGFNCIWIYIKK